MKTYNSENSLLRDEGGAGTAWWIFWMIIFLLFGGVAVDSSNAWRMRAELQFTADAAAHAGVIDLIDGGPAARTAAIDMAEKNMSTALHSNVLVESDVQVGLWNGVKFVSLDDADVFKVNAEGELVLVANAVMAQTRRDVNNSNRLPTYFLRLIGIDSWNVNALAIAQRYFPDCLNGSAIVSAKIVDVNSNNKFRPGICVHAQDYVDVNGGGGPDKDEFGNQWDSGVSVTMPSLDKFYDKYGANGNQAEHLAKHNEGLVGALDEEFFYPKIVDSIPEFLESYVDVDDPLNVWPSYIGKDINGNPLTKMVDGITVNLSPTK
jgi:hypothetical protein